MLYHRVTLWIKVDERIRSLPPDEWGWDMMLGLEGEERVRVLDYDTQTEEEVRLLTEIFGDRLADDST